MNVQAVVWDLGGILHPTPFELADELEVDLGLPRGLLPRGPFGPEPDPDYEALDRGEIDEPEYVARSRARLAARGVDIDLRRVIRWDGRDRPEVVAAMHRIAGRYRMALLTNDATTWLGPGWHRDWYLRDLFEVVMDAAEEGIRKPHPEIYRRIARALDLPPGRCLFVDDLRVNVEGARAVGMEAFRFEVTDPTGSVDRLLATLGLIEGGGR